MADKIKWLNENCRVCGCQLNSWDAKISAALQYKHKCCESCIAKEYGETKEDVRNIMKDLFGLLPCQGI